MSYIFWNDFVDVWINNPINNNLNVNFLGWTNPNSIPLMNQGVNDYSINYLPEPWWGNNGSHPLHSVIINYNPGLGGGNQSHLFSSNLLTACTYQTFVGNEVLGITNNFISTTRWHKSKRAKRILNRLSYLQIINNNETNLENHLSIELIPWHTSNIATIDNYINSNLKNIYQNCILFSASESNRIINPKLQNKVILRISGRATINLLNNFANANICNFIVTCPIGYTPFGNGGYFKFTIKQIPNVEFISLWGNRNDLPPNIDLDWILQNVI